VHLHRHLQNFQNSLRLVLEVDLGSWKLIEFDCACCLESAACGCLSVSYDCCATSKETILPVAYEDLNELAAFAEGSYDSSTSNGP